jgi:hypothetical protein
MAQAKMVERPNNSPQTRDGPFVTNTEMIKVDGSTPSKMIASRLSMQQRCQRAD